MFNLKKTQNPEKVYLIKSPSALRTTLKFNVVLDMTACLDQMDLVYVGRYTHNNNFQ